MGRPEFHQVEPDLWYWQEWVIAFAAGRFWMMTPSGRELGPFQYFDEAFVVATGLS